MFKSIMLIKIGLGIKNEGIIQRLPQEKLKEVPGVMYDCGGKFWTLPGYILVDVQFDESAKVWRMYFYRPDTGQAVGDFNIMFENSGLDEMPRVFCTRHWSNDTGMEDFDFSPEAIQGVWPPNGQQLLNTICLAEIFLSVQSIECPYTPVMANHYGNFITKIEDKKKQIFAKD